MSGGEQVTLNGLLVWVNAVELEGGLRLRVSLDEWEQLRFHRGQQVIVQRGTDREVGLFVAEVTPVPPVVWVVLAKVRLAAG